MECVIALKIFVGTNELQNGKGFRRVRMGNRSRGSHRQSGEVRRYDRLNAMLVALLPISRKHKKITLSHFAAFLLIAVHERITTAELMSALDLEQSTMSRMTDFLSNYGKPGVEGLELIEAHDDPSDRRRKVYTLSRKGQELLDRMVI